MERKLLSLCLVTKNDEEYLEGCLLNFKEIADEIIISDLGSSDDTATIARKYGAAFYVAGCEGDFAAAANICLEHAHGRWILYMQANERISPEHLEELRVLLQNPAAEGYLLFVDYQCPDYAISSPAHMLRLFRNRPGRRFCCRSFEMLPCRAEEIQRTEIQIRQLHPEKLSARMALLPDELAEHPEDPYLEYMAGLLHLNAQRYGESAECFMGARENLATGCIYAPHLYKCLGWALFSLGEYEGALEALDEGAARFPRYSDLLVMRGEVYLQMGRPADAIRDLGTCLKIRELPDLSVPGPEIGDDYVWAALSEIHEQQFNHCRALGCYLEVYALDPAGEGVLDKVGELAQAAGKLELLTEMADAAAEERDAELFLRLMEVLAKRREYARVLAYLGKQTFTKGPKADKLRFLCRMMLRQTRREQSAKPLRGEALLLRIRDAWLREEWEEAEAWLEKLEATVPRPERQLWRNIHGWLMGRKLPQKALTEEAYETVWALYGDFIWLGRGADAFILLPLLLQCPEDEMLRLAKPWAEKNNLDAVQSILGHIKDAGVRTLFIHGITELLLRCGHVGTARRMAGMSEALPEDLKQVLWAREFCRRLRERMGEAAGAGLETAVASCPEGLRDFCRLLENGGEDDAIETAAGLHLRIGEAYSRAGKKAEAFCAWLKALQCEPMNAAVQEKIAGAIGEDPEMNGLTEETDLEMETGAEVSRTEFIRYVRGITAFCGGQFQKAQAYFSLPGENAILRAHDAACLLLMEEEIPRMPPGEMRFCCRACMNYVLHRLGAALRQHPESELLQNEIERLRTEEGG